MMDQETCEIKPRGRATAIGLATALVTIIAVYPSLPQGIRNWDNIVKLQVATNIVRGAGPVLTLHTPDDETYVLRGVDGRYYTGYPPLAYVLQIPTLLLANRGIVAEGIAPLLVLALLAWVLVDWGLRSGTSRTGAIAGALLVCLGTAWWPMTAHGHDNIVEALALVLSLRAFAGGERTLDWFIAGLALAFAIDVRYGAAVVAVPAAVLLVADLLMRGWRSAGAHAIAFGAGAVPGLVVDLWWNWRRFGSPFTTLAGSPGREAHLTVAPFSAHHWEGMAGLLISPGKGLLWYALPMIMVLALLGPLWRKSRSSKGELVALGLYLVVAVFVYGRLVFWHGEWAWGPRYVAPVYVAVAPLAWWVSDSLPFRGRRWKLAAALAFVAAIVVQVAPVVGFPVECQLSIVAKLAESGRTVTRPITRPPLPEDNRVLYFEPANAMPVSLVRCLAEDLSNPEWREPLIRPMALAAIAPILALAFVIVAAFLSRPRVNAL